jgi:hypothetical protein
MWLVSVKTTILTLHNTLPSVAFEVRAGRENTTTA